MKGKELNNLVKTIDTLKIDAVPLSNELMIVDSAHVSMMVIRRVDRLPVFGVESERVIHLKNLLKLPDSEEFDVRVENGRFVLSNDDHVYSFNLVDEPYNQAKVPKMGNLHEVTVPAKRIQDAVKIIDGVNEHCVIDSDGHIVCMGAVTDAKIVWSRIGKCDEPFSVMFHFDYVKRISKVLVGDVKMELESDYPTVWTWCDGSYEYRYLLAPRIECE